MTFASAFVFLVAIGAGLFWSGMSRSKNALAMITACMFGVSVVTIQVGKPESSKVVSSCKLTRNAEIFSGCYLGLV